MQTLAGKQYVSSLTALLVLLLAVIVTAACSSSPKRPVLYPNTHLNQVGGHVAQQDIDACMQ
ncbi:MAG: glycine zipper family protein, partial [Gammaproteobacteria bacterium]|nr:glycine zipper family protein [Gammaproteobacteria bacterium]